MAVVVLPTPPFWLATTSTRSAPWGARSDFAATAPLPTQSPHPHDAASFVALGRYDIRLEFPRSSGLAHLGCYILSLEEQAYRATLKVGPGVPEQADQRGTSPGGDDVHSKLQIFRPVVMDGGRQVEGFDHVSEEPAALGH